MDIPVVTHPIEKIIYKLPDSPPSMYVAQPYGKLCYAWFTHNCTFVDRRSKHSWTVQMDFDPELSGTLLYGTVFHYESTCCFLLNDLFFYKGKKIEGSFADKINVFVELMTLYVRNHKSSCFFMLPLMSTTMDLTPVYKLYSIKLVYPTTTYHYIEQKKTEVFTVRATPKSDIYELYRGNTQTIAYIDTYQRSMFMNTLFSSLEIEYNMECLWHDLFKKWIPIKVV